MTPAELSALAEHSPAAAARVLARYDGPGVFALAEALAAHIFAEDRVNMSPSFLVGAWVKRGLISPAQEREALLPRLVSEVGR